VRQRPVFGGIVRRWGRKVGACLARGFEGWPPDVAVRLTGHGAVNVVISDAEQRFLDRLTYRKHAWPPPRGRRG
jgi:hypothetical protein